MLTPGWHQVELDGVTQAYEVVGQGPVCFAHSGGPGIDSSNLRMPLVERGLTMVYLDPIGTGKSGLLPGGDYSVAEYARRVELLRAHLSVDDGFLLGHSHGGLVTLQYGLDYPGRMRGLIVYDSAPTNSAEWFDDAGRQMAAFAERWPDRPEAAAAARAWRMMQSGELAITDRRSFYDFIMTVLPAYFADFRKTTADLGEAPSVTVSRYDPARKPAPWDARGKLGSIQTPTLILVGTYDFICRPAWSREIHGEIAGSELVEFTESGHFAHVEQPTQFAKSVRDFASAIASTMKALSVLLPGPSVPAVHCSPGSSKKAADVARYTGRRSGGRVVGVPRITWAGGSMAADGPARTPPPRSHQSEEPKQQARFPLSFLERVRQRNM
jgi:pimeloyl-ACP methyl ester carboxylesterase